MALIIVDFNQSTKQGQLAFSKMNFSLICALCFISVYSIFAEKVRYDGYKLFRVTPKTSEQVKILANLSQIDGVSFWKGPSKLSRSSDVMISPTQHKNFLNSIRSSGFEFKECPSDVQSMIDSEVVAKEGDGFHWDKYHRLNEIYNFLSSTSTTHSIFASLIKIGKSFENRDIFVVKISKPSSISKKAIFMDSNIHAREWITSAVMTYFVNELINNPNYASWVDDFDFYILPVANPDGFEFTHTIDRLWRKTRSTSAFPTCFGADPNRNFGYKWMEGGAVDDPCDYDRYAGAHAFSEKETQAMSEFIKTISEEMVFFGSVHSYSQIILMPYGIDGDALPKKEELEFKRIAEKMTHEIYRKFGTKYTYGPITEVLYPASGSSMDWVKGTFDTYLTLSFELRDKGECGFELPAEQILPTAIEFLDGFQVIVDELREKFVYNKNSGHHRARPFYGIVTAILSISIVYFNTN